MSIGYPISDSAGVGTSVSDMRKIVSSHWASVGVVTGCAVSTVSTGLTYTVAAGVAVASRGTTYGAVEFLVPASTVTTDVGPQSGSRYDVIYAKPQDPSQGDSTADVVVGVVKGTAAASPSKPSIPTGAVELRTFLVPQAATKTSQATVSGDVSRAVSYDGNFGIFLAKVDSSTAGGSSSWLSVAQGDAVLPMARQVRVEVVTSLQGVKPTTSTAVTSGSCYLRLLIDGSEVRQWERQLNGAAATDYYSELFTLTGGRHSFALQIKDGISGWKRYYSATGWPGQRLVVSDAGLA